MKYLINVLLYVALGAMMLHMGFLPNNWEYWAVIAIAFALSVNALLW